MASWREPFLGSTLPKFCNPDLLSCIQEALAGRYRVEGELGRGGMATVYLAEDLKRHQSVAVKVLHAELGQLMASDRFLREIEVTAGLHHPHILPVQDSGETGGFLYYVTPYVEGGSLRDRLKQEGQLSQDEALRITCEVAGALAYAHRHGVVHRDIKPGNLLLGQGGVRVADFGIARAIAAAGEEKLTPTGLAIGTPAYMSPEQSSASEKLDGRSDIYSLGCVLYEMLAGEPPYTGPSGRAVIAKHMSEPIPRISVVRETVPPAVEQALLKALAKAPEDRFATADQFADALTTSDVVTVPVPAAIAPGRSGVQALDGFWAALAGHYSVERELGRGGMAIVFLARDLKHDRPVAVKIIRPELGSVVGVERFQREIDLAAKLQHPNIMPVHDSGSADDRLYYVMPYVEGESLRARLSREGQLPLEDALEIAREVANALGYAHGRGVVHRDIKPENILLSGGHPLVLDFGIARALAGAPAQRLTETGLVIGTPAYMSPEQATGERQVDGRSDLYALGCVLYEMLSGEPPYTGPSAQAIIAKRLIEPIPHLRTLREGTPEAVEDAVTRALAKSPADRFATAAEFAAALAPSAITATRPRISPRWRLSRRPTVMAAAVVLVAAAAAGRAVLLPHGPAASPRALPADARRVAVAVFANRTGDPGFDPLGDVVADYLARGLAATKLVEVVDVRAEQGGDTTAAARGVARARALARTLGAGSVVWGAYYHQGDSLELQAQVTDASTGELLGATPPTTGPAARPMEGVEALRQRLMSTFAARLDPRFAQYQSPSASRPASTDAYREFLVGEQLGGVACPLERDCLGQAITHYWRAYALDSSFTLPIVAVAALSGQRGECGRTDSIADALRPRHDRLP
ncbi:MAG: serine/threonine-protein kinase, partial [Deltaproteobacteria bacterium]